MSENVLKEKAEKVREMLSSIHDWNTSEAFKTVDKATDIMDEIVDEYAEKLEQIKLQPELVPYMVFALTGYIDALINKIYTDLNGENRDILEHIMVFIDRPFARIYTEEQVKTVKDSDIQEEMLADKLMYYNAEKLIDGFYLRRRAIAEGNNAPAEGNTEDKQEN